MKDKKAILQNYSNLKTLTANKMAQYFSYIGQNLHSAEISELYETIRDSGNLSAEANTRINAKIKSIQDGKKSWRDKVIEGYEEREIPEFTVDDINKLNQEKSHQIEKINKLRTSQLELWKEISKHSQQRIDALAQASQKDSQDTHKKRGLIVAKVRLLNNTIADPANQNAAQDLKERNMLEAEIRIEIRECNERLQDNRAQIEELKAKKNAVQQEIRMMQTLPTSSTIQRNLILYQNHSVRGWLPSKENYVLLQNNRAPPDTEILKHICYEPETNLTNLPLSMSRLKTYSETIGANDECLLNMILTYLRKHKDDLLNKFESKKHSLRHLVHAIAEQCSTAQEKQKVLSHLKSFERKLGESFAAALNRFDSMHLFYVQLDRPQDPEELKHMSYQTVMIVTTFIISEKCAQAYNRWNQIQRSQGKSPTKEEIIKIIGELEENIELQPKSALKVAHQSVSTLLCLPADSTTTIDVLAATAPAPGQSRSRNQSPKYDSTRSSRTPPPPRNGSNGPPGNGQNRSRTGSRNNDNKRPIRPSSQSPHKQKNGERGRSPSRNKSTTRSVSRELSDLQYPSDGYEGDKQQLRKQHYFKRGPNKNWPYHRENNFIDTNRPDQFKDVRKERRCFRCYDDRHRAKQCPVYTQPTVTPCQYCHWLFHPTQQCIHYSSEGKSRSNSPVFPQKN